jgi:hypothetical protein
VLLSLDFKFMNNFKENAQMYLLNVPCRASHDGLVVSYQQFTTGLKKSWDIVNGQTEKQDVTLRLDHETTVTVEKK